MRNLLQSALHYAAAETKAQQEVHSLPLQGCGKSMTMAPPCWQHCLLTSYTTTILTNLDSTWEAQLTTEAKAFWLT